MKYEASVKKLYQLAREIEERDTHANLQHSIWKLMSFLKDEVPGFRESAEEHCKPAAGERGKGE